MLIEWGVLGPVLWVLMALTLLIAGWKICRQLAVTPLYPLALSILWFSFWVLLPFTWASPTVYQNYIVNAYLWTLTGILFRLPELIGPAGPGRLSTPQTMERPEEPVRVG